MGNVYARLVKLNNICGRIDYISNQDRQENIIHYYSTLSNEDWKALADYERKRKTDKGIIEARELTIAIPHYLLNDPRLVEITKDICESAIHKKSEYAFAIHYSTKNGVPNLHCHLIFSERNKLQQTKEVYKRDVWLDKNGLLAKSKADRVTLLHKKGEIKENAENGVQWSSKDRRYNAFDFKENARICISRAFKGHSVDVNVFDKGIHLPQQKRASVKYFEGLNAKLHYEDIKERNKKIIERNKMVDEMIQEQKLTREEATKGKAIYRNELLSNYKRVLSADYIQEKIEKLKDYLQQFLEKARNEIYDRLQTIHPRISKLEPTKRQRDSRIKALLERDNRREGTLSNDYSRFIEQDRRLDEQVRKEYEKQYSNYGAYTTISRQQLDAFRNDIIEHGYEQAQRDFEQSVYDRANEQYKLEKARERAGEDRGYEPSF